MEMSSVAISAPSAPAATAIQSAAAALGGCAGFAADGVPAAVAAELSGLPDGLLELATPVFPFDALRGVARTTRVHLDVHREPRQQYLARLRAGHDVDLHRHALDDLGEVAGGVLRGQ